MTLIFLSSAQIISVYIFYDLQLFRKETCTESSMQILNINFPLLQVEVFVAGIGIIL